MQNLYKKITQMGVQEKNQTTNFIIATNTGALLAWIITFPYLIFYYIINEYNLLFFTLGILFLYPIPIIFNAFKYHLSAKVLFINLGYIHVTVISIYFGIVTGFELYYYLMPILALLLFSPKEKLTLFSMILLFWGYYLFTQFAYGFIEPQSLSPFLSALLYNSSILFVFVFITGFTLLFRLNSLKLQNELNDKLNDIKGLLNDVEEEKNLNSLLLNSIGDGIFGVEKSGLVNFINPAALELLGYRAVDIIGQKVPSITYHNGTNYPAGESPIDQALQTGKLFHIEGEMLWRKDSSCFPAEYNVRPIIRDNEIMGAVITFVDITEKVEAKQRLISEISDRKQSEKMAEYAKQRLENITNNIPGVVFQFQITEGEVIAKFISEGITQLQSIEVENILKDFNIFINSIYEPDREVLYTKILTAIESCKLIDCDYRIQTADNEFRWIHMEATARSLTDEENDVVLFDTDEVSKDIILNGNLVDVTDTKLAHDLVLTQQKELKSIHKQTRDSIEYASLIQGALIPDNKDLNEYFSDSFVIWQPKDIVGGDIYLVEEIRDGELLIFVIDCTGHGVPGAFVTMLVKAIERQLTAKLKHNNDEVISPAKILSLFNSSMKHLLKQETIDSVSNAGFDGGIIYYNKNESYIKYAGAETPLFYFDEDDKLNMIKGSRHSVGYKKSDVNFEFKENSIAVKPGMRLYLTTDGYLDQNGGQKSFPFGKKKFKNILINNQRETMLAQKKMMLKELEQYQDNEERNDDVTVVGFKI